MDHILHANRIFAVMYLIIFMELFGWFLSLNHGSFNILQRLFDLSMRDTKQRCDEWWSGALLFHDWAPGHFLSCCKMNLKQVDMEGRADLKQKWVIESMRETDYCEEDSWDERSKWEKSRASGGFSECLYTWEVLLFDQVDILQKKENADVPITIKKRMNSPHSL